MYDYSQHNPSPFHFFLTHHHKTTCKIFILTMGTCQFRLSRKTTRFFLVLILICSFASLITCFSPDEAYPTVTHESCGPISADDGLPMASKPKEWNGNGRIIDISHRYVEAMPAWDSEEEMGQVVWLKQSMKNGSIANFSEMKLGVHSGTHVDAPGHVFDHYYDAGFDIDTLDLQILNGPALLVDVPRDSNITAQVMKSLNIPKGVSRVLFRTLNTDRKLMLGNKFDSSYVGFMSDGAKWLVENTDIKFVGLDYLSVAAYSDAIPTHLVFLKSREIILVEGLKLDNIRPGLYNVHCLPLRLVGAEGSPARCILMD